MWQKFEDFIQSLFSDSEIQQCGFYLFKRLIDSGGIRVVLWSLYQDFEMAAAQARHTDNHEHPRIRWETKVRLACFKGLWAIYPLLGCPFLSFDNVPACLTPHIFEAHLFFMQQTVDFRD